MVTENNSANLSSVEYNEEKGESKIYFLQKYTSLIFRKLGSSIGKHTLWYCLVPLIIAILLGIRILWVKLTVDTVYLYCPINGRSLIERDAVESMFPSTSDSLDAMTITRLGRTAFVILEAKDGGSVLREIIMDDVALINDIIYNITVTWNNQNYSFIDLCGKTVFGECQYNNVLSFRGMTKHVKKKQVRMKFPFDKNMYNQTGIPYSMGLGGVTIDKNGFIMDAKAIRLIYIVNSAKEDVGFQWDTSFIKVLANVDLNSINISYFTAISLDKEFNKLTEMVIPMAMFVIPIMAGFAVFSSMTSNWVTSKPWVAVAGCVSPMLGASSAFGLLLLLGNEYVDINIVIPFLLLGIGLDDSFVILAAWRRTDPTQEVHVRMSNAYEESATSITITSVTNILSISIGLGSPYRVVRIFCLYAAVSFFIEYIYQITFFGGILALSGYRERNNCHSLLCIPVKEEIPQNYRFLKVLYFGWRRKEGSINNRRNHSILFFVNCFISFLRTAYGKGCVVIIFVIYIASSAYCFKFIKEEFKYKDSAPFDSYVVSFHDVHYKHFTQYPHVIQIAVNKTLDYSDTQVQKDVEEMLLEFSNGPNMAGDDLSISWLKFYIDSTRNPKLWLAYRGYNISEPKDFVSALKGVFLKLPRFSSFRDHLRFNENGTEITASRFFVASKDVVTSEQEKRLVSMMWSKADSSKFPVYVHSIWFPVYNVLVDINSSFVDTLCAAVGTVTLVFLAFIPSPVCFVSIVLTIISIQIGVMGYMSLWGVSLNYISMICIILSIGLSVDYAAHISYAYLSSKVKDPSAKMKVALRAVGYPIIQGCLSTILGVIAIGFGRSNSFIIFFKVLMLVMVLALFHGLIIIPVLLNILETTWNNLPLKCKR